MAPYESWERKHDGGITSRVMQETEDSPLRVEIRMPYESVGETRIASGAFGKFAAAIEAEILRNAGHICSEKCDPPLTP